MFVRRARLVVIDLPRVLVHQRPDWEAGSGRGAESWSGALRSEHGDNIAIGAGCKTCVVTREFVLAPKKRTKTASFSTSIRRPPRRSRRRRAASSPGRSQSQLVSQPLL
jgi:hypothetical protein